MLDLAKWAADAPVYYARLRSLAIPNGVARYGDEPLGGSGPVSKPPISLGAWEAAEGETVALWRVLAHCGANRPFDPFMRGRSRRVVGIKSGDDTEMIVQHMADDVLFYMDLLGQGVVPSRTLTFCHKSRNASIRVSGNLTGGPEAWISQSDALEHPGVTPTLLAVWRHRGRVLFKRVDDVFFYDPDSFNRAVGV